VSSEDKYIGVAWSAMKLQLIVVETGERWRRALLRWDGAFFGGGSLLKSCAFVWVIYGMLLHLCVRKFKGKFRLTIFVPISVIVFYFIFRVLRGGFLIRILGRTSVAVFIYVHFMCTFKGKI
jgi:hypothetical protein